MIPSKRINDVIDIDVQFNGNGLESLKDAKNLGIYFDNNLNMSKQIKHVVSTGYYHLRKLWSIGSMLSINLKTQLVHSFILSRIDYCNACLHGVKKVEIYQLQKLINSAARFIFKLTRDRYRCHISPYLKELHFLPVEYRIKYKVVLLTYKCINNLAPAYLKQLITLKDGLQSLRVSNDYFLLEFPPLPKTVNGYRRFSYVAPLEWNMLPFDLRACPDLSNFKRKLKTYYFQLCFT